MKKIVLGSLFANCSWTNSCQTNHQSFIKMPLVKLLVFAVGNNK